MSSNAPASPDRAARAQSRSRPLLREALARGRYAARANVRPALLLQGVALLVALSYYYWEPARTLLQELAAVKLRTGYLYSLVSTALFGGLLPYGLQILQRGGSHRSFAPSRLAFLMGFWGIKGVEVDFLYHVQDWLFGSVQGAGTLAAKVLVDQFVYLPLWALPTMVIPFVWADSGFRWAPVRGALGRGFVRDQLVPVLLANWVVWIPTVAVIYLLPLPLQLPLQNLVLCLWSLLVLVMTHR